MKIVVFDLDETLGYFTQFGIFWEALSFYTKKENIPSLLQNDFNEIFDLFPNFLRPNIINILNYLKKKKQSKCCHKMVIYTNNNGSREWVNHIIKYFENKINYKLIDQIILAFKVNGKNIEVCRTTYNKTHNDFIKCTKIPLNSDICFLDDTFFPQMANQRVYYINIKPYYYDYSFEYMLDVFIKSNIGKKIISNNNLNFKQLMMNHIKLYDYNYIKTNSKNLSLDKNIGKNIIQHLKKFFNRNITQKRKGYPSLHKTRKKI
jgi:hypothetical protein